MQFRFLNIPVHIAPSFWLFVILFSGLFSRPSLSGLIIAGIVFMSLLVHEYGHALTAARYGAQPTIVLEAFGGKAFYTGRLTPIQEFLVTLNGPLFESLLIFIPYALLSTHQFDTHPFLSFFLKETMRLNIIWVLFNLLPIYPLDGGHLLRYLLERKFGEKGAQSATWVGIASIAFAIPVLFALGMPFFSIYLIFLGVQNAQLLRPISRETPETILAKAPNLPKEEAKYKLHRLIKHKDPKIRTQALEELALIHKSLNELNASYEWLLQADLTQLKKTKFFLAKLSYSQKNYLLTAKLAHDAYAERPLFETALQNAKAFAYLDSPEHAGAWLETALKFPSPPPIDTLLKDPAFEPIQDHPAFKAHLKDALDPTVTKSHPFD